MFYLNIVVFKIHKNPLWIISALRIIDFCIAVAPFELLWSFSHCTQWTIHFKIVAYKWKWHIHLISILNAGHTVLLINDTINAGSLWPIICLFNWVGWNSMIIIIWYEDTSFVIVTYRWIGDPILVRSLLLTSSLRNVTK